MEQPVGNDNDLGWFLQGPDDQNLVWLVNERCDGELVLLGPASAVATTFADWLEEQDFGERADR
jgi:hypothetical protein